MFYFHKVAYMQYLGEVEILHRWVKITSSLQQCKNYKNRSSFPKLWSQMYCHLFMVHSVYYCARKIEGLHKA